MGEFGELEELESFDETRAFGRYMLDLDRRVSRLHGWRWHQRKPNDVDTGQRAGMLCFTCNAVAREQDN